MLSKFVSNTGYENIQLTNNITELVDTIMLP